MNKLVTKNPYILSKDNKNHKSVIIRHRKEMRFRYYGLSSIIVAFVFLAFLLSSIVMNGSSAFIQTEVKLSVTFSEELFKNARKTGDYTSVNCNKIIQNALKERFPDVKGRKDKGRLYALVGKGGRDRLCNMAMYDKNIIGKTIDIWIPASSDIDMFMKGRISREINENRRRIKNNQIKWIDSLEDNDSVRTVFNANFFTNGDSREPEVAGILGATIGSLYVIAVCLFLSFPIGVCAAIYLEEFAPKTRLTDVIEVSINNLAAVPSIVYGLLALAVFLNFFGLPRSSPLVGGLALSLLVLPTIVITTRNALAAVPPSIKDAAIGLGASPMQVLMHHTLPLSMPGIMTGTILSTARALGETAPLLMIGMVAFVADIPTGITSPATALPVQIYLWSDSPELGFVEKTSAAIMVLLAFLIAANTIAVYLRKKYEYKW